MEGRIARHRGERPAEWTTVEEPYEIVPACRRLAAQHELVLVDCLTLWVSNRLGRGDRDEAVVSGADELAALMAERRVELVVVSNDVGAGVHPPTELGLRFQDLLGVVNQRVAGGADRVTLMVAGIPVTIKDVSPVAGASPVSSAHDRPPEAP
jgi:adenosylcobinamide kinase/adenosylcobinamide-phosphate guanylyltransferase